MPKDVFKQLEVSRDIKFEEFLCMLINDFHKTGNNCASFSIPVTVNKEHKLMNFQISIQPLNATPKERMN